ncbi:FliM/FliN family flagellar motor switch protein [Profundibacter amoris]|uniref:FliM/FliN family flagellar motor switch protein n=1 Tax=Profundibacter amoris TaxID=2171755 RepID=A0A347UEF4_9RHOB|nr:FliM/FliN family flagellar motor C-terminal domain-containing protein [Profundibacter amoris]AXX97232.1 FliM/FliN family flagellar motor switch protein [Profundibacter amoris]
MGETTQLTTLQRKAGAGRGESESAGMTPAKALRLALSKAAQDELSLALRVQGVTESRVNQPGLLDALSDDLLLLLLEGPQGGLGVGALDIQALAALIEVQTMGQVLKSPATQRRATATDSAMCAPLLDRVLQEFEGHLAGSSAERWTTGFRFGERVENTRLLGLRIDEADYRLFRIALDMADGAKQGEMLLALPADGGLNMNTAAEGGHNWAQTLQKTVQASHVDLLAVLHRMQIPLAKASAFKPGDLVPVPQSAIGAVQLEGVDGRIVGVARLGQQNGHRALRISDGAVSDTPAGGTDMANITSSVAPEPLMDGLGDTPLPDGDMPPEIPMMPMGVEGGDGLPDLPMAQMDNPPAEGIGDIGELPMAAMPMDLEIG